MVSVIGVGGYGPTTCQTPFSTCEADSLIPAATVVGQALRSAIAAQEILATAQGQQLGGLGICSTNPNGPACKELAALQCAVTSASEGFNQASSVLYSATASLAEQMAGLAQRSSSGGSGHALEIALVVAGIALGVAAVATGVGAVVITAAATEEAAVDAAATATELGQISFASALAATALDERPCLVSGNSEACFGFALGVVATAGAGAGLAGSGAVATGIAADSLTASALNATAGGSALIGFAATITDAITNAAKA
jgi:hypothetical protein